MYLLVNLKKKVPKYQKRKIFLTFCEVLTEKSIERRRLGNRAPRYGANLSGSKDLFHHRFGRKEYYPARVPVVGSRQQLESDRCRLGKTC